MEHYPGIEDLTLAKIPGDRAEIAPRRLEEAMARVKSSRCARDIASGSGGKGQRVREVGLNISVQYKAGKTHPNDHMLQEVGGDW